MTPTHQTSPPTIERGYYITTDKEHNLLVLQCIILDSILEEREPPKPLPEAPPAPESWLWRHVNPIVWGIVIAGSLAFGAGLVRLASAWLGWGLKG